MKRVQLVLSEHLDAMLWAEARRTGTSRSAMARRLLERALREGESGAVDGRRLLAIAGVVDSKGRSDARDVDEVVYGAREASRVRRQRAAHRAR